MYKCVLLVISNFSKFFYKTMPSSVSAITKDISNYILTDKLTDRQTDRQTGRLSTSLSSQLIKT